MVLHDAPAPPQRPGTDAPPPVGVSRRSLLKGIGVGAATVVVAGTGALSYRVFDTGVLDPGTGSPYDAWQHWRDDPSPSGAVGAAILAANPHNTQPWIFRVTPARVDVFADPTRTIGTVDPLRREQHVGLGCALENLVLAATARGLGPDVTLLPDPTDPTHVASVALTARPAATSPLYDALGDRHSNRGPYTAEPLTTGMLDDLAGQTAGLPGAAVRWFTSDRDRQAMTDLILRATEDIVGDEQQSLDGFAWFRNDRADIIAHADGLTLDAQGLAPLTLAVGKLLPATSRTAGDAFWLTQTRTVHTATATAYGVLTVPDPDDPAQRLVGGRALQRIHLAATAAGLGLQHMNQVTERIDREGTTGMPATYAPALDALLATPGMHALSTFRVGHPVRSPRPSPRRPLGAVTR